MATEHHSYVTVAMAVPEGVICLLSALSIHGIGTQMPWEVWVSIPRGNRIPAARSVKTRAVTMSGENYSSGIETHTWEGVPVMVYSLEKTIVDCFRLRRLVGHDVPVDALRDSLRDRRVDRSSLVELAGQLRCRRMMEPYLEAIL